VPEDIRALSTVLAADPASLVYVDLAEVLRRRGDLEQALRVVNGGLTRHPEHADGLDCLGRIHANRDDLPRAREAWGRALAVAPDHLGALKGMGFALFRKGDAHGALAVLERALEVDPADDGTRRALDTVRRALGVESAAPAAPPPPAAPIVPVVPPAPPAARPVEQGARATVPSRAPAPPPPAVVAATAPGAPSVGAVGAAAAAAAELPPVFRGLEGATADILLFDDRGLVVAGGLNGADGADVSALAAAGLAGVSSEAGRTAQYLALGAWTTIVAEADRANLVLAPVGPGALLLVRRERDMPVGLALRVAERAQAAASAWLARQGE
jgi:predicted regulator of Ras-like GTPase activity (Roadblock/LC7/MglB family)